MYMYICTVYTHTCVHVHCKTLYMIKGSLFNNIVSKLSSNVHFKKNYIVQQFHIPNKLNIVLEGSSSPKWNI